MTIKHGSREAQAEPDATALRTDHDIAFVLVGVASINPAQGNVTTDGCVGTVDSVPSMGFAAFLRHVDTKHYMNRALYFLHD